MNIYNWIRSSKLLTLVLGVAIIGAGYWGYQTYDRLMNPVTVRFASAKGQTEGFLTDIIKAYQIDKKHGINLEVGKYDPLEAYKAIEERKVDAGILAPYPAARAQLRGKDIRLFAPIRWNVTSLLVDQNSPYKTLEDLRGKKIGVAPCGSSFFIDATITLASRGYDFKKDFKVIEGKTDDLMVQFNKGELDAIVMLAEPRVSKEISSGNMREIVRLRDLWKEATGDYAPCHSVSAYNDWIDANPKVAKRLSDTFIDAIQFIQTRPEVFMQQKEALRAIGLQSESEIAQFRSMIPSIYPSRWDETSERNIALFLNKAFELGLLDKQVSSVTRLVK